MDNFPHIFYSSLSLSPLAYELNLFGAFFLAPLDGESFSCIYSYINPFLENGVRRGVTRTIAVLSDKLIEVLNLTRLFGGPGLPRDQADEGNITSCFPEPVSLEGLNDAQRTDFCTEVSVFSWMFCLCLCFGQEWLCYC